MVAAFENVFKIAYLVKQDFDKSIGARGWITPVKCVPGYCTQQCLH